jgi:hypothetical protein
MYGADAELGMASTLPSIPRQCKTQTGESNASV